MSTIHETPEIVMNHVDQLVENLQNAVNALQQASFPGTTVPPDKVTAKPRTKFIAIDIGSYGAYLVEKTTGEIYNIKAYGVPDRNKKVKADVGNVFTVDAAELLRKRWNYLR